MEALRSVPGVGIDVGVGVGVRGRTASTVVVGTRIVDELVTGPVVDTIRTCPVVGSHVHVPREASAVAHALRGEKMISAVFLCSEIQSTFETMVHFGVGIPSKHGS